MLRKLFEHMLDKIRKNKITNWIMFLLGYVGLDKFCSTMLYKYYEKNPTESMKESCRYFANHQKEIENIQGWLSDEKSRRVWRGMIEFRKTMKFRLHPKRELPQYFVEGIIKYGNQEVFIDCGGFDGMTSIEFLRSIKLMGGGTSELCYLSLTQRI